MKTATTSVGFKDPLGVLVANGNLILDLSQAAEVTSGGGLIVPTRVVLPLDAAAKIAATQMFFNDELTPSGTTYRAVLLNAAGSRVADFGNWSIIGASADLSVMVPTSTGASYPAPVLLNPVASQTISQPVGTNLSVNRFEGIRYADQFSGADMGAKITNAIADLPTTGGTVDCSAFAGDNTVTSGTIALGSSTKPVKLIMPAGRIISAANPVISVAGSSKIIGVSIGASSIINNGTGNDAILWTASHGVIENVLISSSVSARHGLVIQASGTNNAVSNEFRNVRIAGGGAAGSIGLRVISDSNLAIATLNKFFGLKILDYDTNIKYETTGTQGPTDNWIYGLEIQSTTGLGVAGISILKGDINYFCGGFISGKTIGISTAAGVLYNQFQGLRLESNTTNINNAGTGTQFDTVSLDANTITDTGAGTVILGITGNVSFTQKKGSNPLGGLVPNVQTFTANGTFTIPSGITAAKVVIIAGGGAGGGASTTTWGSGGGSGGTGVKYLSSLTPGNTITVTIGAGGTGVANATGNTGGDSTIASGTQTITTVTAKGGVGGLTAGGAQPGGIGGAIGTNGDINVGGQQGGNSTANTFGGVGAPSSMGGGGSAGPATTGNPGLAPGAGGGGAGELGASTAAGGAGLAGMVIFEWSN